ncbi:hypothetical protein AB4Z25_11715 [Rhizobium sp. RAF36]|uniref:hypothetical protein n=1 Tax=Rhizobium sp. RAF36 TaxID=3233055 RepID=UPI003F988DE5
MKAYVIDSNMLQSDELRRYLKQEKRNLAILPDFAWYELYKQQSLEGLRLGLSVVGDHPEQVILLRSGGHISRLDPAVAEDLNRLVFDGPEGEISELVRLVRSDEPVKDLAAAQLNWLWDWARNLQPSLIEGAADIAVSFPEMQEQMFNRQEVRIIRRAGKYTEKMVLTIFGAALQIWETLAGHYEIEWEGLDETVVCRAYLFRYALGIVINLLWWIRGGSQAVVRMDRMSNDLIDLGFAVYATYFDGLFTRDEKAAWVHANLVAAITTFRDIHSTD